MQIWKKVAKNIMTSFGGSWSYWLHIILQIMARWGKVCFGSDLIWAAVVQAEDSETQNQQDASFVWVSHTIFDIPPILMMYSMNSMSIQMPIFKVLNLSSSEPFSMAALSMFSSVIFLLIPSPKCYNCNTPPCCHHHLWHRWMWCHDGTDLLQICQFIHWNNWFEGHMCCCWLHQSWHYWSAVGCHWLK